MKSATLFLSFALLLFLSVAQAADPVTAGPERVIRDFYRWYVQSLVDNTDLFTKGRVELKRYATERLIREIDQMRKGPDGLNGDYFVDAQDFDKDWGKNISTSTPVITGERATVEVELKGRELGARKLRVSLVETRGVWKVDKVLGQR